MWHLQMKAATRELTARFTQLANLMGFGGRLMPGTRPQPTALAASFENNALTSDRDTFGWCVGQLVAHPELGLGGPSMQWTKAALEEMARLYIAPLPNLPTLVLLGTDENVVSSGVIRSQVAQMARGELVELAGARHEIFMERPEVLAEVWRRVDGFLAAVPARRGLVAVS
jgi:lysophospholipase